MATTRYQTLVISAGQTGYLPKNAKIVALTTTGDTTASSTCIDLGDVPDTQCYSLVSLMARRSTSSTIPFTATTGSTPVIRYKGVMVKGTRYLFDTVVGNADADAVIAAISTIPSVGPLVTFVTPAPALKTNLVQDDTYIQTWTFSTIPDIGDNFYLICETVFIPYATPGTDPVEEFLVQAHLRSDLITQYPYLQDCSGGGA